MLSEYSNLKISVSDVGELKFPVTKTQAKALIKNADYAPFGHREKTMTDLSIRNVWEIKKNKIKIDKRAWNKTLNPILDTLQDSLGFPPGKMKADLDKLLIYEKGQFFVPHQDSEKEDGMLGSLIVVLPSAHKGGTLIVSHHGEKKVYKTRDRDLKKLKFLGLYSDCHHEIKKVTEGYRVALTYNITIAPTDSSKMLSNHYFDESDIDKLKTSIKYYFDSSLEVSSYPGGETKKENKKLVYLLEHQYTQNGLSSEMLKNGDYLKFNALKQIADTLELNIFLALVDIHEVWSCEYNSDFTSYGRKDYGYWYEDSEEEEEEKDDSSKEMYSLEELAHDSTELNYWKSSKGKTLDYGSINVHDDEIFLTKTTDKFDPFNSKYEGWMGNYGNTLDRWYHRAAIVLWSKKNHFDGIFGSGSKYAVSVMEEGLDSSDQSNLNKAIALSTRLPDLKKEKGLLGRILKLIKKFNNVNLAQTVLECFNIVSFTPDIVQDFLKLSEPYGEDWCLNILNLWHKGVGHRNVLNSNQYLLSFIKQALKKDRRKWDQAIQFITQINVEAFIEECQNEKNKESSLDLRENEKQRTKEFCFLLDICLQADHQKGHDSLIQFLCSENELFPFESLETILKKFHKNSKITLLKNSGPEKIYNHLLKSLEGFLNKGLKSQNDWSMKIKNLCHCMDCKQVESFLISKKENIIHLPMPKDRRKHIHRAIESFRVYVSHETLRKGSPYTLVLKKLPLLFTEEARVFRQRKDMLTWLQNEKHLWI